jgi:hypothetical protein
MSLVGRSLLLLQRTTPPIFLTGGQKSTERDTHTHRERERVRGSHIMTHGVRQLLTGVLGLRDNLFVGLMLLKVLTGW